MAWGVWRLIRAEFGSDSHYAFLVASLLTVPLSVGALRNGQGSAIFAALTVHSVACLAYREWWPAAWCAALAVAARPLGIVLILLAPFVYARCRWRLAVSLVALAALPFLFAPPAYVVAQHRSFVANIQACAVYTGPHFADISGLLRPFGVELPAVLSKLIRVAAGACTLGLWWLGARRLREPFRALWLLALTGVYLMLFNPMNEGNSYVILAPALGLWAGYAWRTPTALRLERWIAFISLSMAVLPEVLRPLFGRSFMPVYHPLMTLMFLGLLIRHLWGVRGGLAELPEAASPADPVACGTHGGRSP
jgi:hypothetical protein